MGFVYIVEAVGFNRLKIGYWNGSRGKLRVRYVTCYGNDLCLHTFKTPYPELVERLFKQEFVAKCICCELYEVSGIDEYKLFFSECENKSKEELDVMAQSYAVKSRDEALNEIVASINQHGLSHLIDGSNNDQAEWKKGNFGYLISHSSEQISKVLMDLKQLIDESSYKTTHKFKRIDKNVLGPLDGILIVRRYLELLESIDDIKHQGWCVAGPKKRQAALEQLVNKEWEEQIHHALSTVTGSDVKPVDQLTYQVFVVRGLLVNLCDVEYIRGACRNPHRPSYDLNKIVFHDWERLNTSHHVDVSQ